MLSSIAGLLAGGPTVAQGQVALDSFNPSVGLTVLAAALQPDGKIVIGGDFTTLAPNGGPTVTRNHIARLNPDGTVDPDFNPNANGQVRAIAVQADGKVLAGGSFTSIGGQMRNYVARLDATTGQADSFDPKPNPSGVDSIALQADGKVLLGGAFTSLAPNGGVAVLRQRIARLNESGTLDTSFGLDTGANNSVLAIVPQSNGNILVGGLFTSINGMTRNYVAKLTAGGAPVAAFNAGVLGGPLGFSVNALAVQADGNVVIVGSFTSVATQTRNRVARLDGTSGAVDSFNPNANNNMFAVAVQPDGKILVGGGMNGANSIGGATRNRIARLDPATGLADSFDPNASNAVFSILQQPDGKILLGGSFTNIVGQMRNRMARLGDFQLLNAVSRKEHAAAGVFDINLPLVSEPGVECRNSGGNHTLVFTTSNNLVSGNAGLTSGVGNIAGSPTFAGNTMTVNLAGVGDVQKITVTLSGVTDSLAQVLPDTAVSMNMLIGDTNGDRFVNSGDVLQTRNRSGQTTDMTNFRSDVNIDGTINSGDQIAVRSRSGNFLP